MSAATDAYIERAQGRFVEEWRECCRIPSVTGSGEPIDRMADWIGERLEGLFDHVHRIPIPDHGPLLFAALNGSGSERLLVYTHYDVQPPGDLAQWSSPPFEAAVRDGCVYARGACDDKADLTARLQALEAWLADLDGDRPPFTLLWLSEPAEEIGSPGLAGALAANSHQFRADACLWESFLRGEDGRPGIGFGCRGLLEVQLRVRLLRSDQHPAFAPILRSAPMELARVLTSLVDERGRVLVTGFHDAVRAPTPAEAKAAAAIPLPTDAVALPDRSPYVDGDEGRLRERLVFSPAMTVTRTDVGEEGASVVAAEASATLHFELVPDQDPVDLFGKVRAHLAACGFGHVELTLGHAVSPAKAPLDSPFANATIEAARDVYGEPVVYPVLIGVGPGRLVLDHLGAPTVSPAGTLRPAGGIHAPDEHGSIADYLDHVRFTARLFELVAERGLR